MRGRDTFLLYPSEPLDRAKRARPYRLDLTVWTLRRRPDNVVDHWDGQTYARAMVFKGKALDVAVRQRAAAEEIEAGPAGLNVLEVEVTGPGASAARSVVTEGLERLLGVRIGLEGFYRLAAGDSQLGSLAQRFMGLRPPRYLSMFEALINAVACQQITLTQGIRLLGRLTEAFGKVSPSGNHAFPEPEDMAGQEVGELRAMGFSTNKARAILGVAEAALDGWLDGLEPLDDEAAIDRLRALRGVGKWTAEYALLRGAGRLNLFPGEDAGVRNNLKRWLHLDEPPAYPEVRTIMDRWKPYAGLVYFHLLLDHLEDASYLPSPS